jgi:hypothetical protein
MKIPRPTKRQWIIICIFVFAAYSTGYFGARQACLLVHRACSETRTDGTKRYDHSVDTGDFSPGEPYFTRWEIAVSYREQRLIYWFFTPLRWVETIVWYIIPRDYELRNAAKPVASNMHTDPNSDFY